MTADIIPRNEVQRVVARRVGACPYIQFDEIGYYCSKGMNRGDKVTETRRMVCDEFSLQLWCLTSEYGRCIEFGPNGMLSNRVDQEVNIR
jgi:hypothetical protein